ncbi:hypothetical protein V6R21_12855 [Limibacter armeniacum]|uniref:hypothetical protein n=1 Tax=Limibacter armeniacum TaxID=466084 RepID=UPI002FE512C5
MKINQISNVFDNYDNNYALDEDSYIIAIQDSKSYRSSKKFIIPLFYYDGENWEKLDFNDLGNSIFLASKPLETEYLPDELIKVKGLRTNAKRTEDEQYNSDNSLTKYVTHADKLDHLYEDHILDIFKGKLDLDRQLFYPDKRYYDLIEEVYVTHSKKFLIEDTDNGKIYGAFTGVQTNSETKSIKISMGLKKQVEIFNLPESLYLELDLGKYGRLSRKLVKSYQDIELYITERIDFLSRRELFDWVEQQLEIKSYFDKSENLWEVIARNSNIKSVSSRYERLKDIFDKGKENVDEIRLFLGRLAKNDFFKSELGDIEKQKLELENELNRLRLVKSQELSTIDQLKHEVENIKLNINSLQEDEEKIREALLKEREEEINRELDETLKKLETVRLDLKERAAEIEIAKTYNDLQGLQKEIEELNLFKADLEKSIGILQDEFIDTQNKSKQVLHDLIKTKTHFDFLTGRNFSDRPSDKPKFIKQPVIGIPEIKTLKELTQAVHRKMVQAGRNYPEHFVANLLISVHQNSLTLLWGLPGTGKTSLAKKVTESLVPNNRIVEVPVARGWTSQKDLIGFANPISKRFHKSSTGVYDLLSQLNMEMNESLHLQSPYSYIILDEANLSPMEHYWGLFYNLTDSYAHEGKPICIDLGDGEKITYANNLRFIGTMNIDRTTEEISPRLLDRTPIIRLDLPRQMQFPTFEVPEIEPLNLPFELMRDLFDLPDFKQQQSLQYMEFDDPELEEKYDAIETTLRQLGIYISPRVKKSIVEYCNVAHHVMSEQLRPLDYCIAQRILTKIDLQGHEAHDGLKKLLEQINEFSLKDSRAASVLSRIIAKGEREGYSQNYFNYFMMD